MRQRVVLTDQAFQRKIKELPRATTVEVRLRLLPMNTDTEALSRVRTSSSYLIGVTIRDLQLVDPPLDCRELVGT